MRSLLRSFHRPVHHCQLPTGVGCRLQCWSTQSLLSVGAAVAGAALGGPSVLASQSAEGHSLRIGILVDRFDAHILHLSAMLLHLRGVANASADMQQGRSALFTNSQLHIHMLCGAGPPRAVTTTLTGTESALARWARERPCSRTATSMCGATCCCCTLPKR